MGYLESWSNRRRSKTESARDGALDGGRDGYWDCGVSVGAGDGAGGRDGVGKRLFGGGVGEFLPELGMVWEMEPLVPLFLQNLRMFLTLTIEVLRARVSLPGARLFGLWSSGVESSENLLDGALSSLMIIEVIEGFLALWVGLVGNSGTAGTGGTSSNGTNDEGYLPKGSGERGMMGDSRDRGGWRGGYKASSCLCFADDSSKERRVESFPLGNSFWVGCITTPFRAHCGWFARLVSKWRSRASAVNAEYRAVGQPASSDRLVLKHTVRLFIEREVIVPTLYSTSCCSCWGVWRGRKKL